jgi:hypothetical protein
MPAKETKVYPVAGRYLVGTPAVEQTTDTKAEADELVATGAFTDNPRAPERDKEAPAEDDTPE